MGILLQESPGFPEMLSTQQYSLVWSHSSALHSQTHLHISKQQVLPGTWAQPMSPSKCIPTLQEAEAWVCVTCTAGTCHTRSCINRFQGKKASSSIARVSLAENHNCFVWKLRSVCVNTHSPTLLWEFFSSELLMIKEIKTFSSMFCNQLPIPLRARAWT